MNYILVAIYKYLCQNDICVLEVCKLVRPDIFSLERSVERLHMSVLLQSIPPDGLVSYSKCLHGFLELAAAVPRSPGQNVWYVLYVYVLFQKTCNSDTGLGCPANNVSLFQARHKHPELLIRILPQSYPHVCIHVHRHAARSITYATHFILTVPSSAKSYTVFISGGAWERCLHPHALHLHICGVAVLSALLPCETSVCPTAALQTPQSRRSQTASLPPTANRTVTNQLFRLQSSPATKPPPCPVTKQTRYNLSILPSEHTATAVIIYNLQAPTSIDNPSIRHTVTKQTRHHSIRKTGTGIGVGTMCRDYTLNIISRADQDYTISCLLSRFC